MARTKKVISVMLCLIMVLGTMAAGISAFATTYTNTKTVSTVPTYAKLTESADASTVFFSGLEVYKCKSVNGVYEAVGNALTDGAGVSPDETLLFKAYLKTGAELYTGSKITYVIDNNLFDTSSVNFNSSRTYSDDSDMVTAVTTAAVSSSTKDVSLYDSEDYSHWTAVTLTLAVDPDTSTITGLDSDEPVATFTAKVNDMETLGEDVDSGSVLVPAMFYTTCPDISSYPARTTAFPARIFVGGTAAANSKVSIENFTITDEIGLVISNSKTVTFYDGTATAGTADVKIGENLTESQIPSVDNLYAWADADGNFVDDLTAAEVNEDVAYYAVKNSDTVQVTLNANNGEEAQIVNAPVTGLDLSAYTPVNGDAKFAGWADASGNAVTGTYNFTGTAAVTLNATWEGEISIYVTGLDGNNTAVATYDAAYGSILTSDDILSIQKILAEKTDDIKAAVGAPEGAAITYGSSKSAEIVTDKATNGYFSILDNGVLTSVNASALKKYPAGSTLKALVLTTNITYNVYTTAPQLDADGNLVEQDGKPVMVKSTDPVKTINLASNSTTAPYDNGGNSLTGATLGSITEKQAGASNYSTIKYSYTYADGNGAALTASKEGNIDFAAANISKDDPTEINIVINVTGREYYLGFTVGSDYYGCATPVAYGDTITLADMATVDQFSQGDWTSHPFTTSTLYENGATVKKQGMKLDKFTYTAADGSTAEVAEGTSITIDEAFVTATKQNPSLNKPDFTLLCFSTLWVNKQYTFNIYYLNTNSEWTLAATKVYEGSNPISYANAIGTGSELETKIAEDIPESLNLSKDTLAKNKEDAEAGMGVSMKAYDAEEAGGTMDIYVCYKSSTRTAFADYNNDKDQDGNDTGITGAGKRYEIYTGDYGCLLYDEKHTVTVNEDGTESKNIGLFDPIIDNFYISTNLQQEETDDEGNVTQIDLKAAEVTRPYRDCENTGYVVYYTDKVIDNFEDVLLDKANWKVGYNDRNESGEQHLYTTSIVQIQWKADSTYLFRVYDDKGNISFAMDKNFKTYYWKTNTDTKKSMPCSKGENVLVEDEGRFCIMLLIKKEENVGIYLKAVSMSSSYLNINNVTAMLPTLINLIKGLIK